MLTDNYILYILAAELLLVAYRKCAQRQKTKSLRHLFSLALIALTAYNIRAVLAAPTHFKFLGLPRGFTDEEFAVTAKAKLAALHPDRPDGDNDLFIKTSELKEIYESPRGKRLFELHTWFGVDPREIFFDKFSSQNFETFQYEVLSGASFNGFAVALIHVLLFEEVTGSTMPMAASGAFIFMGIFVEAALYGHPYLLEFQPFVQEWFTNFWFATQSTMLQLASLVKLMMAGAGFLLMVVYFEIKSLGTKKKFEELWGDLSSTIQAKKFRPEEQGPEVHRFSQKIDKRVKNYEREMRTVFWSLVISPIGLFLNYFGNMGWVVEKLTDLIQRASK